MLLPGHLFMSHKPLTRRAFSTALAIAPAILKAAPSSQESRVKIDTERIIGSIDKKIYGNFTEHLGRCIEGGIFEEASPLSDTDGFRKDVLKAVEDLHVTLLRWPGGNFSSNYNWTDGIGPRDQRPKRLEMAWHTIEDNRFGTHEFLRYCEVTGCTPYICTNLGTGNWTQAQQWVEYCNVEEGTAMSELRRKNGRAQAWGVKYWGLGNEMDGPWQMGHRTADDYGKFALEAAKLMKWTDPTIQLVAAGSSNYGADWVGWNRTVLEYLRHHADYLSMHMYVGNRENNFPQFMASSVELDQRTKVAEGIIDAVLSGEKNKKIYIAWDEWNVWYRARGQGKEAGRQILEEQYNLEDALVVGTFLNSFINHAHIVKIANMAQLVNVIAPIFTNKDGLFLQTIYYPLALVAAHSSGQALQLWTESPTYSTKDHDAVPYLDFSATYDNGDIVINAVNRHETESLSATFELEDKKFSGEFAVSEVNGPDIKSQNTFGSSPVTAVSKQAQASGTRLRYTFPAHSFTQLRGRLA
jgi:alpha-L-arabinofuranosidase